MRHRQVRRMRHRQVRRIREQASKVLLSPRSHAPHTCHKHAAVLTAVPSMRKRAPFARTVETPPTRLLSPPPLRPSCLVAPLSLSLHRSWHRCAHTVAVPLTAPPLLPSALVPPVPRASSSSACLLVLLVHLLCLLSPSVPRLASRLASPPSSFPCAALPTDTTRRHHDRQLLWPRAPLPHLSRRRRAPPR